MWMVYNQFGEEVCGAENEEQARILANIYEGSYKFVVDPWSIW